MTDDAELRPWWRQPLFHFILAGALLFAIDWARTDDPAAASRQIRVGAEKVDQLRSRFERRHDRQPSDRELGELVDSYVRDEVLYREALKLGLHRSDRIVRRRLVQAMEFLTEDMTPLEEPDEAELRAYFREHRGEYRRRARYRFRHVFYPDRESFGGENGEQAGPLERLGEGANWKKLGRPFIHGSRFRGLTSSEVDRKFGPGFAERLSKLPTGEWRGPVQSKFGRHFVYLEEKSGAGEVDFEDVREQVKKDLRERRRAEANRRAVRELRGKYEVTVESESGGGQ